LKFSLEVQSQSMVLKVLIQMREKEVVLQIIVLMVLLPRPVEKMESILKRRKDIIIEIMNVMVVILLLLEEIKLDC
jgi:hypothetical protein